MAIFLLILISEGRSDGDNCLKREGRGRNSGPKQIGYLLDINLI